LDGEGANGIYTAELIRHLRTPGLTIEQVFKRTRAGVIAHSGGTQIPAEYSRLVGDDIFLAGREPMKDAEEVVPKGRPIPLPTLAEIKRFAVQGDAEKCIQALRQHTRVGSSLDAMAPLTLLLDQVKESLRDPKIAATRAGSLLERCDLLLAAVDDCLPDDHPQRGALLGKVHNRRGDALLLLGKPEEALNAFNAALALTPDDAYVLYNRGAALLRLDRKDEAKADFTKVAAEGTKQLGARKLATEALAELK
jgi:tetratricopeptide (TPR) repeat protein